MLRRWSLAVQIIYTETILMGLPTVERVWSVTLPYVRKSEVIPHIITLNIAMTAVSMALVTIFTCRRRKLWSERLKSDCLSIR